MLPLQGIFWKEDKVRRSDPKWHWKTLRPDPPVWTLDDAEQGRIPEGEAPKGTEFMRFTEIVRRPGEGIKLTSRDQRSLRKMYGLHMRRLMTDREEMVLC